MENRISILDCPFDTLNFNETVAWVDQLIASGQKGYICTVNVSILIMMRSDPLLNQCIKNASLIVPDGQPILWVSKYHPLQLKERITGMELMYALCELAEKQGYRVSFLGSHKETVSKAVEILKERYPKLIVSAYLDGYFKENEEEARALEVDATKPHMLFLAMGAPKQEIFIDKYRSKLNVNLMLTIGGALDVVTGKLKRAPVWMQKAGLEWLYRLIQEPKRLWRRYFYTNTQFILLTLKDIFNKLCKKS